MGMSHGHDSVVKLLLAPDNVNVDSKDNKGRMPFLFAVTHRHEPMVKLLLAQNDVDMDSKSTIYIDIL